MRINSLGRMPTDAMAVDAAAVSQRIDEQSARLHADIFITENPDSGVGRLFDAFRRVHETTAIVERVKAAQKDRRLPKGDPDALAEQALEANVIDAQEAAELTASRKARLAAIEVDVFTEDEFFARSMGKPDNEKRAAA